MLLFIANQAIHEAMLKRIDRLYQALLREGKTTDPAVRTALLLGPPAPLVVDIPQEDWAVFLEHNPEPLVITEL